MDFRLDKEILSELGRRARSVRLHDELSQEELAQKAGVSRDTIQRFEGSGTTTLQNLVKICRVLDLLSNIDQIFSEPTYSPREAFKAETHKKRKRAFSSRKSKGKPVQKASP